MCSLILFLFLNKLGIGMGMSGWPNHSLLFCVFFILLCIKCVETTNPFCPSYDCGNGLNISYPFWLSNQSEDSFESFCGHYKLRLYCHGQTPTLYLPEARYYVKEINYSQQTFTIVNYDFISNNTNTTCPSPRFNLTFSEYDTFSYYSSDSFLGFFYNCSFPSLKLPNSFKPMLCLEERNDTKHSYWALLNSSSYYDESEGSSEGYCENYVRIPTKFNINTSDDYRRILEDGVEFEWYTGDDCDKCENSDGFCQDISCCVCPGKCAINKLDDLECTAGISSGNQSFVRYCAEGTRPHCFSHLSYGASTSKRKKVFIGISVSLTAIVILVLLLIFRSKLVACNSIFLCINNKETTPNVEMILENYGSQAPRRYTYSDIKKMTNSFKDKLGQGGFGGVFKGKLPNGLLVAVKLLNEPKGKGEDFINEVTTIGRTNHLNIVSLVGFCYEGSKQALIYEFMPNGSLEKFIYAEKQGMGHSLGWEKLYGIALGIARGLEYLHLGCNTRILHFDIKPHNILLDKDFCPKISDFGLAKLCPTRDSIVSMVGARGTTGYIAPEVYCRNFGGVSYKSDVYSYGMMLLEMVGGRKNIDVTVENLSEIYFPQWIYKKLQQEDEGLKGFEEIIEDEMAKKMVLVGLWCIQTDQAMRPSMSRVLEMLEGNIEDLQVPPSPFMNYT